ncbi:hypothetical protein Agabi119p4_1343 [Agaricus bisporus var. burnettii]|uniref:Protein kinase domain-containing protein n=1 Tax=Agaricus bisporus var. burnettii TaxID=192524 RepID=A0A8H7FDG1_AGABI|nr:hypothetical protein Agabi119p4_1343 [Agaricus bisporus var. burnettii]
MSQPMDQEPAERPPKLRKTYYQGLDLQLHASHPPPTPASNAGLMKDSAIRYVKPIELYKQSIAERTVLPSTPPALTITLEKRLSTSTRRVPHVWTAHVRGKPSVNGETTRTTETEYPPLLVAKIFDPVFFDGEDADLFDAFLVRDISVSSEVKSYEKLKHLQGTVLAQFYGLFVATLPTQHNRPVYIILLEKVPGNDLYHILPPDVAEDVCPKHRDAILDNALNLLFDFCECGVNLQDMNPRNIILRPQKHEVSEAQFCTTDNCPAAHKIDCNDLHLVMIDFESVEFMDEQDRAAIHVSRQEQSEELKLKLQENKWLESRMLCV